MLAWVMTACWVLRSRLTYFWRNMSISSIFHFSKSTSINTLYSSLWHTLKMMLFTKCLTKWKCIGRISWEFQYSFNLKSSIELDIKRYYVLYLSNAPLTLQNFCKISVHFGTFEDNFSHYAENNPRQCWCQSNRYQM